MRAEQNGFANVEFCCMMIRLWFCDLWPVTRGKFGANLQQAGAKGAVRIGEKKGGVVRKNYDPIVQ